MSGTTNPESISTKQARIANIAWQRPNQALTPLSHHIDLDWLREAHRRTRKDAAPGIDAQTAADFEQELEANLQGLLDRAKSGTYRAPPVRRVNIPKGDGRTRPIGIPTHEDKVLQRAVVMVLEPIYEQEFHDCSFGFRPGRSAHDGVIVRLVGGVTAPGGSQRPRGGQWAGRGVPPVGRVRGGVEARCEQSRRLREGPAWPRACKGGRRAGVSTARRLRPTPDHGCDAAMLVRRSLPGRARGPRRVRRLRAGLRADGAPHVRRWAACALLVHGPRVLPTIA